MQIRKLKTKDLLIIAEILAGSLKETKKDITKETNAQQLGISVFSSILEKANDKKTKEFLSSLINVTVKEFEEMEMITTLNIIEELKNSEEVKSFFSKLSSLYNSTGKK